MLNIGFIGCGNMGQAMIGGMIQSGYAKSEQIHVSDLNEESLKEAQNKFGIKITTDNKKVAVESDILVLSVKPHLYPIVIDGIKDHIKDEVIIVTIAAGKAMIDTQACFGKKVKIARVMPNTPALIGEAMSALCGNEQISTDELKEVYRMLEGLGQVEIVSEKLMDAVTAVSGSSPAYVYMFIEAMADGAVLEGIPRNQAYKMAAQSVLGAAKMVLETGMHPGELKDMVCSPGGTTIEAVGVLEEKGLRSTVIEAMRSCASKSKQLSNK